MVWFHLDYFWFCRIGSDLMASRILMLCCLLVDMFELECTTSTDHLWERFRVETQNWRKGWIYLHLYQYDWDSPITIHCSKSTDIEDSKIFLPVLQEWGPQTFYRFAFRYSQRWAQFWIELRVSLFLPNPQDRHQPPRCSVFQAVAFLHLWSQSTPPVISASPIMPMRRMKTMRIAFQNSVGFSEEEQLNAPHNSSDFGWRHADR